MFNDLAQPEDLQVYGDKSSSAAWEGLDLCSHLLAQGTSGGIEALQEEGQPIPRPLREIPSTDLGDQFPILPAPSLLAFDGSHLSLAF